MDEASSSGADAKDALECGYLRLPDAKSEQMVRMSCLGNPRERNPVQIRNLKYGRQE